MAAGDTDAARTLVRRYQQRVFGLAFAILRDRQLAEDVAQEAFLRAWRHAGAFDARRSSCATWLLTITRNAAIDAARLRRAEPVDPELLTTLVLVASEAGPDERAAVSIDVARVRVALESLPTEQQQALLLAAFYGRTASEIATIVGIPLGTAKTRVRTALRRLRAGLRTDGAVP
jgi:RNA polymerase sigma factor (sigma-70 family)